MKTLLSFLSAARLVSFAGWLVTAVRLCAQTDDLAPLSDEFTNPATLPSFTRLHTVEGWGVDRLTTYDIHTTRPGALVMVPRASGWYQDYQGELAFKSVTGDFVATTEVGVTNVAGTGAPGANYSFAGLLVRAPRPGVTSPATWTAGGENWVVQGVGAAGTPGSYSFEVKNTVNSATSVDFPAGVGRATLQFARVGAVVLALRQPAGGAWTVAARYRRADFPATLQVGLNAMGNYTASAGLTPLQHNQTVITGASADLVASFEFFHLRRPAVPAALAGRDLADPAQVSDAELLAFLGANALATPPPVAPPPTGTDDLAALSDEFNDAGTLAGFQRVFQVEGWGAGANKLQTFDINTSAAGRLVMIPYTSSWFNNYVGELAFKSVTGDFVLTTETLPRNRAGTGAPGGQYSLSGLMVRAPSGLTNGAAGWQTGRQNYVFLSHGAANNPGTFQHEVKTTTNSQSTLAISAAGPRAEIQIARLGGTLIMLRRDADGGPWLVHQRYARPDFPPTLQAGLTVYTDWGGVQAVYPFGQELAHNATVITGQNPDLRAEFEYLRYRRPQIPAELVGRDFANPAQVSDAELLSFLGANANVPGTNAPANVAPNFTTLPASQSVNAGANVTFTAAATGTPPPVFQWQRNGTNLPGATGAALVLNSVQPSDAGNYSVVASNAAGLATSPAATLTVTAPTPPAVTSAPASATVLEGSGHTFTVVATGTAPLAYQWQRNGTNLPGATNASLALTGVATNDSGAVFRVVVSNGVGSVTSAGAVLTVNALPPGALGGFPNVTQVPGRLLTPLLAPQQGRTAVLAYHNGWLYSVPELPSSLPNSDFQVRRWNISDLANVVEVERYGISPQPVMAHGYLFLGRNLVLGANWPPEAPWSFRAESPGVNRRVATPEMQGVFVRGHLYQPWNINPTYWSYDSNPQRDAAVLSYDGQTLATFDHLGQTGGLIGHPFIVGNILIYASDQSRTGVATYDISDPRNPVLLDVLKTGGPGGYWPELWGGDGKLYVVFPYREPGNGIRVVDVTDPANLRFVADVPLPGAQCMYVQFQDEFAFTGSHKVDMRSLRSVLTFDARGQRPDTTQVDTSQFALPLGNLLVTGGVDQYQGMAIWAHQAEPDLRGPAVSYHIPRAGQANYSTSAPISLLIHETLRSETIEFGTNLIVRPLGGQPISARWVLAFDDTLTISPDGGLQPNTTYEVVVVGGGIRDVAGNGIEPLAFTFSTGGNVAGNRAPVVTAFTVSAYPAATNQLLTFTAAASDPDGQPLEFRFDFGDGSPRTPWSTNVTTTRSYPTNGHFPTTVQVRDPAGLIATRALTVTVTSGPAPGLSARSSSSIALHPATRQVWVVNPDNNSVQTLHADTLARGTERTVSADPRNLAFDASGNAWVTCHKADRIDIVSPAGGVQSLTVRYGGAPFGIVTSPDGGTAYVSLFGSGELVRFNTANRTATGTLAIGPTPRALALNADGTRLYVTRFLSLKDDAEVWEVDTASLTRLRTFRIHKFGGDPHRDTPAEGMGVANQLSSLAFSRDGTRLLVTANKMNTERGTARGPDLDDDNTVRNVILFIDLATGAVARSLDVDNSDSASSLALSPLGDYFFATLQGNNDLALFDSALAENSAGLGGLLSRQPVGGAPQGVCVDPVTRRAFVQNLTTRTVTVLELDGFLRTGALVIPSTNLLTATTELVPPAVRRGKEIFYHSGDRRMSAEGYLSCATCHLDGGHDGRVWDFTGRGEGLRNTTTLHGRGGTAHGNVHWSGNFDEIQDFEHDMRSAFGGTGFLSAGQFADANTPLGAPKAGLNADLDALAAYVASLGHSTIPRSPHRAADGALTSAAQAGAAVFAAQNCASCHAGSAMTDRTLHDVGTLRATSGGRLGGVLPGIDTPTLRGVASTAPYFHDGSAAALEDVFRVVGGTLLPAELGVIAGAAIVVSNDLNYVLNFDETAFGHAFAGLGNGGSVTFANVNGGAGGLGAIEIRYANAYRSAPLAVRVNGTNFPVALALPFNEPAWRSVNWLTHRLEDIPLRPGPDNTIVLEAGTTDLNVDHIVVANADDFARAQPHRRVLALPQADRDNLLAFLRELDGSALPGELTPPVITAPPVSAIVLAGTNHTFTVSATGDGPLSYQWLRNNAVLPGATSPSLVLNAVTRAHSGSYSVTVTGPGGTNLSAPAALRVMNYPRLHPPQRLANGAFRLHFGDHDATPLTLGDTGNFEVWASPDLHGTNWVRVNVPLTVTDGLLTLEDADAPQHPRRFYRVIER